MRLARRALWLTLTILTLCAAATAQTLRSEGDPRNIAPTVGTGGQPGGPTGLFTIYDGQTLRRGEFTLSIAYSNFDRDPGNVDLVEVPVSVQIGLSDHLELFFNTDAYRGIKVNNPANLSSFYLPNSQLFLSIPTISPTGVVTIQPNALRSGGIVVQTPRGTIGTGFPPTIARLAGGPFFVPFPFVGGPAAGFGFERAAIPFSTTLGPASGGNNNFGAAGNFPGIGSPVGSILPGIILTTTTIPATLTTRAQIVPATFTIAPSYLPDAPFINRLYGESSFNTFTAGAKIALTAPERSFSVAVVPFYRWYADKADDAQGFNQLQRGSSPGGNFGDIGVVAALQGRLSKRVSISVNGGYILNSNPKSDAFGGGDDVALLDRPDEFVSGIGFDFPVNRHFQFITELKSVRYVGGRTPAAFQNNPVDFLGGIRIFPRRWFGMSAWYRAHLNQQGNRLFNDATAADFPAGFLQSEDPHGYGFQFFAGRRNLRAPIELPNQPPVVTVSSNPATVRLAASCGTDQIPAEGCTPTGTSVQLSANASDPDGDTLLYTWSTTGGRITGDGPNVSWDLSGVAPGSYTATVEVDDGCGCVAFSSTTVTVEACNCVAAPRPTPPCPTITVDCPTGLTTAGQPITFTANVSGGDPNASLTYNWTVSAGTITSGQGTSSITVDTAGLASGTSVTATVTVGGLDPSCTASQSCTAGIQTAPEARRFDTYGNIRRNDEKARLDNFANELQANPGAQGYIIGYGGRTSRPGEGQARADRAKDYLVNSRGIDAGRIVTVDGGHMEEPTTELWIVPQGATPPTASPTVDASEVRPARPRSPARRAARRRGRDDDE